MYKIVSLWDGAHYGPTRFVIGCQDKANSLMNFLEAEGYVFDSYDTTQSTAMEITKSRSEDENKRAMKWLKKFWNIQEN